MIRLRHTDEWVGALVIAAVALLLIAALQAGVLREWFKPTAELRLVLPSAGVAGLEVGADVEILGTRAGRVNEIVLDPRSADVRHAARSTSRRRPSSAGTARPSIRRRFGVAGAAFVDISRGTGEEMDWTYAVVEAVTERAPTDSVSALIDEVRQKVFPILDNAGRVDPVRWRRSPSASTAARAMSAACWSMSSMMKEAEATVGSARDAVAALNLLMADLAEIRRQPQRPDRSGQRARRRSRILAQTDQNLATLKKILDDVAVATQRTPAIAKNRQRRHRPICRPC